MSYYLFSVVVVLMVVGLLAVLWMYYFGRVSFYSNREKGSSFECGFDKKSNSFMPFSLRFFFLLLLFLVFDIELTLLLQLPLSVWFYSWKSLVTYVVVMWVLLVFMIEEYRRGLLCWVSW